MIVNGEKMELGNKKVVNDLIEELNLNHERIVIEIDKEIIPKENFDNHELNESNIVEVISFVGGG
jgi:sulfur carrier protein